MSLLPIRACNPLPPESMSEIRCLGMGDKIGRFEHVCMREDFKIPDGWIVAGIFKLPQDFDGDFFRVLLVRK